MTELTLNGNRYTLLFNGAAMFKINEICGDGNLGEILQGNTSGTFEKTCEVVAELARQGELFNRYLGDDNGKILTPDEIKLTASPYGIQKMRIAAMEAIAEGYKRGTETGDIDLGLAELNQKKR